MEILSPAGSPEALKAAVLSGADAVYFGIGEFNARRNADNFDNFNLNEAVKYCHSYNVKVYVTLNTIVFDKELNSLYETVKEIAESQADAVIVQDFATVKAVKKICPTLPLHASTQMAVHNVSGVKVLEKLGFSRVVLARELSFKEIEKIVKSTKLETEVFVHGAHCMSVSGNCYISAFLGERSGNRGLCAQPCRLDWKIDNKNFALSLKDMSYIDHLKDLEKIGVTSLKIEGRMKRPEYVAASVTACKNALNNKEYNKELLKAVFSRSGFTDGYLMDKRSIEMFGYRSKDDVISATSDVFKELQNLYKNDTPVTPVSMTFTVTKESTILEMTANGVTVTAITDGGEVPIKNALSVEMAEKNLKKLGGTPYELTSIDIELDEGLMMPVSALNALRRRAIEELGKKEHKEVYAGDIVEIGTCEEVFYDPKHPYTWALLSSLPQLGVKGEDLYAIKGTPPNLFNKVRGDAFAPRNPNALKIDFEHRPPYFEVSPTHKARTWLLDPRAPKVDPPAIIQNIRNIKRGGIDNG